MRTWNDLLKYMARNAFDLLFYALLVAVLMLPCWGTMVLNAWLTGMVR